MSEPRVSAVRGAPTIHSHSESLAQGHSTRVVLDLARKIQNAQIHWHMISTTNNAIFWTYLH